MPEQALKCLLHGLRFAIVDDKSIAYQYSTLNAEIKGFDPNAEELNKLEEADDEGKPSQEESSSDTTDADEAWDLEELLDPGDPVYFNYASAENNPSSLTVSLHYEDIIVKIFVIPQNPGKSFSIKGSIITIDEENKLYKFELHTYTNQVHHNVLLI